jgi:beta-galactosidase
MHSENENPGLLLDWKHFVTDTWTSYVRNQSDVIRAHADPRQFVTINSMRWNARYDHFVMHRNFDIAAWDNYIPDGRYVWADNALLHDAVRGYKRKNFWVMETQAAYVNYGQVNRSLDPGQMREMAWQAVGHGADALLYWQWRSALNGQEQYYGTLVGPDGEPVPAYREAKRIGAEFAKASAALAATSPRAHVALIQSYESRWALDIQPHNRDFDPAEEFAAFYRPLEQTAQVLDVISPDVPLGQYRLVVAPALNVLAQAQADHLAAYVRQGGHLILGPRSGLKNEYDALWPVRQPGPLAEFLGGHVEQFYALENAVPVTGGARLRSGRRRFRPTGPRRKRS